MGGYVKRCWGLNIYFKVENPKNKRIQELFIGGKRVARSKTYTTCFVTKQGVPAHYGTNHHDMDLKAIDALLKYLDNHDSVSGELCGTVVPI